MKTRFFSILAVSATLLAGGCATNRALAPSTESQSMAKVISTTGGDYSDTVGNKYTTAWLPPADLDDQIVAATARVTVSRDGSVISAQITKPSGNRKMDKSIQATLEKVTFIEPFPASSKEQQRTFSITFDLKTKRSLG